MKPCIYEVIRRIGPLSRERKAAHLSALIKLETGRSQRRAELEAALKIIVNADLEKHNERERRVS
jgi:hypothetical protein